MAPQSNRSHLPVGFEVPATVLTWRKKVRSAARTYAGPMKTTIKLGPCTRDLRCRSGLCPICSRQLRKKLLKFLATERLHDREWYFVTIFVDGWTQKPGDFCPFGRLRDHSYVKSFLGRLRRAAAEQLIVFGSVEVAYKLVANNPFRKAFHLHLMISGTSKKDILVAARKSFPRPRNVAVPILPKRVASGVENFVRSASYAMKQPFWRYSYASSKSFPRRGFPKPNQLAELIAGLGAHPWNGRLILLGVRFDQGTFRMT